MAEINLISRQYCCCTHAYETLSHPRVVVLKVAETSFEAANPKKAQDALCEGLGLNDNRVVSIHLLKYIDPLHPHLDVEIEALDDWRFDEEYKLL
jgi:hypothetical protein